MIQDWTDEIFDDRERDLWKNVQAYNNADKQAGLPGHNLMVMMGKMAKILNEYQRGERGTIKGYREADTD